MTGCTDCTAPFSEEKSRKHRRIGPLEQRVCIMPQSKPTFTSTANSADQPITVKDVADISHIALKALLRAVTVCPGGHCKRAMATGIP